MRFMDEKEMWYADTVVLAELLANKTEREIREVLDKHDVIQLKSRYRPKKSGLARLTSLVVVPLVLPLCLIKWIITGDHYLDSWTKKFKPLSIILNYISK